MKNKAIGENNKNYTENIITEHSFHGQAIKILTGSEYVKSKHPSYRQL